ncbi:MAG: virulence factor [Acidimicrobiia bacterium]|nr:virulence factor [Acidimicrobiia bacterium]
MAELITIQWRDIPAQVTAREGRRKVSIQLTDRFQTAIDRAAAIAGKETTDDYLAEWHRTSVACGEDLVAAADDEARRLEETFTDEVLRAYVRRGGFVEGSDGEPAHD